MLNVLKRRCEMCKDGFLGWNGKNLSSPYDGNLVLKKMKRIKWGLRLFRLRWSVSGIEICVCAVKGASSDYRDPEAAETANDIRSDLKNVLTVVCKLIWIQSFGKIKERLHKARNAYIHRARTCRSFLKPVFEEDTRVKTVLSALLMSFAVASISLWSLIHQLRKHHCQYFSPITSSARAPTTLYPVFPFWNNISNISRA